MTKKIQVLLVATAGASLALKLEQSPLNNNGHRRMEDVDITPDYCARLIEAPYAQIDYDDPNLRCDSEFVCENTCAMNGLKGLSVLAEVGCPRDIFHCDNPEFPGNTCPNNKVCWGYTHECVPMCSDTQPCEEDVCVDGMCVEMNDYEDYLAGEVNEEMGWAETSELYTTMCSVNIDDQVCSSEVEMTFNGSNEDLCGGLVDMGCCAGQYSTLYDLSMFAACPGLDMSVMCDCFACPESWPVSSDSMNPGAGGGRSDEAAVRRRRTATESASQFLRSRHLRKPLFASGIPTPPDEEESRESEYTLCCHGERPALAVPAPIPATEPVCTATDGQCYMAVASQLTGLSGMMACAREGATLATIHNQEQNDAAWAACIASDVDVWRCRFGLYQPQGSEEWLWAGGSEVDYVNWMDGEPNDGGSGEDREDCAGFAYNGMWHDIGCGGPQSWGVVICQFAGENVPQPPSSCDCTNGPTSGCLDTLEDLCATGEAVYAEWCAACADDVTTEECTNAAVAAMTADGCYDN